MPQAVLFLEPVDWKKLQLPLYPIIIKNPMDLKTIKEKLDGSQYKNIFEIDKDMKLVWSNAKVFNRPGSDIYKSAGFLCNAWSKRFASVRNDPVVLRLWGKKSQRSRKNKSLKTCKRHKTIKERSCLGDLKAGKNLSGTIDSPEGREKFLFSKKSLKPSGKNLKVKPRQSVGEKCSLIKQDVFGKGELTTVDSENGRSLMSLEMIQLLITFPRLFSSKGYINKDKVMTLSMSKMKKLGKQLSLSFTSEVSAEERRKSIFCRLDLMGRCPFDMAVDAPSREPPSGMISSGVASNMVSAFRKAHPAAERSCRSNV